MLYVWIYLVLLVGLNGENVELDLSVDQTHWVDPNDPLASSSYCSKSTLDQLAICKMGLEECLKDIKEEISAESHVGKYYINDPTLKHILRNFLYHMNIDIDKAKRVDRTVEIYISADSLAVLKNYLNSKEETVAEREQVREILEEMVVPHDYEDRSFLKRVFDMVVTCLPVLNVMLLLPAAVILIRNHFSTRSLVWLLFFVSFVISVFNSYHRKRQENFAARMSRAEKTVAERCKSKNFLAASAEVLLGLFFTKQKSECVQYYEDLYIDPIYEISPLDIICDVLSNFIFTPLGVFGRHFNIFFNEFYRDSPLHIVAVKTITFIFLVAALLFWLCGYRLRTLVATLEPAGVTYAVPQTLQSAVQASGEGRPRIEALKSRPEIPHPKRQRTDSRQRDEHIESGVRRRSLSTSFLKTFENSCCSSL